ncbi:CHASE domain-containing protein [Kordiimonas sp.]|uniref:CHASE domain-containing protein n=1 Tax=Kordiimonas sp. TaxID=1970157 RepID=UPI003A8DE096
MTESPPETELPDRSRKARMELLQGAALHWSHWLVVSFSLLLTFGAWYIADAQVDEKNRLEFERQSEQVVVLVQERMHLYENALWGGVALIDSHQGDLAYETWRDFATSLNIDKAYPGINGIGIIFNVDPAALPAFLQEQRDSRPSFKVHPEHDQMDYWPITYIEPIEPNKQAVGLDMAFEANRYAAVKKARDTGQAQVTGPITLVQDAKQTPGFLFYAPFYQGGKKPDTQEDRRNASHGVTYAPFIMGKLMQGTLASANRQVNITITDKDTLLYGDATDNVAEQSNVDPSPLYSKVVEVAMYGRIWRFHIESSLSFRRAVSSSQPLIILGGGLLIDALLLALFMVLVRANRRALTYADSVTFELREQSGQLARSNKDLEQFAYLASHDLKAPLNSINQIVGWIEEDCAHLLPEPSKKHLDLLKSRSKRLMKLLTDLLEYSQVGRVTYELTTANVAQIAAENLAMMGAQDRFQLEAPDQDILVLKVPFETVMRNLISNTIKHHDQTTGKIVIKCFQQDNGYRISYEDDGPGIPDDMHGKALEMFQTLRPRDQVEGSGMGLSLIKKIMEHVGGSLRIETGRKRGLHITVFWPLLQDGDHLLNNPQGR